MLCPFCNAHVPENMKICPDCGLDITSLPPAEVEQAPQGHLQEPISQNEIEVKTIIQLEGAARLLLKRGGALTGEEFPIGKKVIIGRFHEETGPVDVDLSHLPESIYISRRHAEIYQDAFGVWFIKDLGSTSGTYLLSQEVGEFKRLTPNQPTPLKDGDEIAFANARFIFRIQS